MQIRSSRATKKSFDFGLKPAPAWMAILGFTLFSALCLVVKAGLLRIAFPGGAFLVGLFLYGRYPLLYLGFTWWIAFLAPWVRRMVDHQSGWVDPSPILLAPFLVMLVTIVTLLRSLPRATRQGGLPFILAFVGVIYGFLVGLIKYPPMAVAVPMLNWFTPILFGFHLFVNWRSYPSYRQSLERIFLWGVLVSGTYGVYQYLVAPQWDRFWLVNSNASAFGTPEPLGIRVFSIMNSPGPFATVMLAGLMLLLSGKGNLRFFASGVGYLSFLLSLVRSAWLGWAVAMLTFLPSLKPKLQMRLVVTIVVMALCIIPLINLDPFADTIGARLQSLTNTKGDVSYSQRSEGYAETLSLAFSQFLGQGLGFVLEGTSLGSNDSGILSMFFSLGWFGTIPYLGGIILLLFSLFQSIDIRADAFASAARAISLGVFAQIGLGSVTLALSGVVFWGFAGMALAASQYHRYQRLIALQPG